MMDNNTTNQRLICESNNNNNDGGSGELFHFGATNKNDLLLRKSPSLPSAFSFDRQDEKSWIANKEAARSQLDWTQEQKQQPQFHSGDDEVGIMNSEEYPYSDIANDDDLDVDVDGIGKDSRSASRSSPFYHSVADSPELRELLTNSEFVAKRSAPLLAAMDADAADGRGASFFCSDDEDYDVDADENDVDGGCHSWNMGMADMSDDDIADDLSVDSVKLAKSKRPRERSSTKSRLDVPLSILGEGHYTARLAGFDDEDEDDYDPRKRPATASSAAKAMHEEDIDAEFHPQRHSSSFDADEDECDGNDDDYAAELQSLQARLFGGGGSSSSSTSSSFASKWSSGSDGKGLRTTSKSSSSSSSSIFKTRTTPLNFMAKMA